MISKYPPGFCRLTRAALFLATLLAAGFAPAKPSDFITGNVRVQLLSDSLVRIELRGSEGFENRKTFQVVNRDWPGTAFTTNTNGNDFVILGQLCCARPAKCQVIGWCSHRIHQWPGALCLRRHPDEQPVAAGAGGQTGGLVVRRLAAAGAAAMGLDTTPKPMTNGGWDLGNNTPDVYVFVPRGDYRQLRKIFSS